MYAIMIMFPARTQSAVCLVDPAIFLCFQKVVAFVASTGLVVAEEREGRRPTWECWVHVTAKRRAVLSSYLLHWSYSVYHGLESFACSQLGFMPAPAPKYLWHAACEERWADLYDRWLAAWEDCPYTMRDFAAIQAGTSLDGRAEAWLEETDELGILFFTIGSITPHRVRDIDSLREQRMRRIEEIHGSIMATASRSCRRSSWVERLELPC